MPEFLETNLKKIAQIQRKHTKLLALMIVIFTIVIGIGLKDLKVNSDIRKEMPTELTIFKLNDRIADKFGGSDTVVIAAQLDVSVDSKSAVRDIRDPDVIRSLIFLDGALKDVESISSVASPASFFRGRKTVSDEEISAMMRSPSADAFFSKDYSMALMYVTADLGSGEEKIQSFNRFIV